MEMRGLKNIVESMGTKETLHGIEMPPEREDYTTHAEWYARVTYWKVSASASHDDASS